MITIFFFSGTRFRFQSSNTFRLKQGETYRQTRRAPARCARRGRDDRRQGSRVVTELLHIIQVHTIIRVSNNNNKKQSKFADAARKTKRTRRPDPAGANGEHYSKKQNPRKHDRLSE